MMKQQPSFTVVGTRENNIDRTSLFLIVIIVAQSSQQIVTVVMVEQCCDNIIFMNEQLTLLFTESSTTFMFTLGITTLLIMPVDNMKHVVRFCVCRYETVIYQGWPWIRVMIRLVLVSCFGLRLGLALVTLGVLSLQWPPYVREGYSALS